MKVRVVYGPQGALRVRLWCGEGCDKRVFVVCVLFFLR